MAVATGDIPAVNEAGVIARKYRHKLSHQDLDLLTQPSFQVCAVRTARRYRDCTLDLRNAPQVLNDARALGRSESAELPVAEVRLEQIRE